MRVERVRLVVSKLGVRLRHLELADEHFLARTAIEAQQAASVALSVRLQPWLALRPRKRVMLLGHLT